MAASEISTTPINTLTRDNLTVLIANNIFNDSLEFASDGDIMDTASPIRHHSLQPIGKKLFHSPISDNPNEGAFNQTDVERCRMRKARKRKQVDPESRKTITQAYVTECEREGYSPEAYGGMRKRVLISLFHNKEYCMEVANN